MALPALTIGQDIFYYTAVFDAEVKRLGPGPFAAKVTAIDTVNNEISIIVFPPGIPPVSRTKIKYHSDVVPNKPFMMLTSDGSPACGVEKIGTAILSNYVGDFAISWINPAGSAGTFIRYRVTGSGTWLSPNQPGGLQGNFSSATEYIFTSGMTDGVSYDILILNVCANSVISAGIVETATAVTAP